MGWQGQKRGWKNYYSKAEYDKAHHLYYYELHRAKFLKDSHNKYINNPAENRNWALKRKFGITLDAYKQMSVKQKHVCAICHQPELKQGLAVDHCHFNGRVRGLLCSYCNRGLGFFKDSILNLESAVNYLRNV